MNSFTSRLLDSIKRRYAYTSTKRYISYLKNKGIKIGNNFVVYSNGPLRNIVIDTTRPSLVSIGDNVCINKNFILLTHDFVSAIFLRKYCDFIPSSGAVEIGNNVSFGANCTVLKNVKIGDNSFIAAGSIVTKDIPSNCIAAGIPCKVVCSMDDYYERRKKNALEEAFEYARSIQERYHRRPAPEDFYEEFPYFIDKENISQFPDVPVKTQLQEQYELWLKKHIRSFNSFDDFLNAAGIK